MAKRQTDTKIWTTQRWFKNLHPNHKLAWKYLTDVCDHAGIWKVDFGQLVEDTGIAGFDMRSFIDACNQDFDKENGSKISRERIKLVNKTTVWLTGFVRFQYENKEFMINPSVPAIKSAITILNGYGILQEALDKGYITLSKPIERTIDRDRDKEEGRVETEGEKGGMGEGEGDRKDAAPLPGAENVRQPIVQAMGEEWRRLKPEYPFDLRTDSEALFGIGVFLARQIKGKWLPETDVGYFSLLETWARLAQWILAEDFYKSWALAQIGKTKNIQTIWQKSRESKSINGTVTQQGKRNGKSTGAYQVLDDLDKELGQR